MFFHSVASTGFLVSAKNRIAVLIDTTLVVKNWLWMCTA